MAAFKGTEVSESEEENEAQEQRAFPDAKVCGLCREHSSLNRPLGYVAFVQPSNLVALRKTQKKAIQENVKKLTDLTTKDQTSDVELSDGKKRQRKEKKRKEREKELKQN
jgi:hypothetical protein